MRALHRSRRGGSVVCCSHAVDERIDWQRHPNQFGDVQTHGSKLQLDPTPVAEHSFHAVRLRIVNADNVTDRQLRGDDLLERHAASLGRKE